MISFLKLFFDGFCRLRKDHLSVMINFLKENSYLIFKMFVNQLGMTMFGLVLSMATSQNETLFLISSIFAVVFYMVLLYTMTWDVGYAEKVRIDGKRLKYRPMKGLLISLCANIGNLILGILITIGYYSASSYTLNQVGAIFPSSPQSAVNLFRTAKTIATLFEGMYSGIISCWFLNSPWVYIVITFPAMLTCMIAYIMGVKGIHFTKLIGPDEKKD